MKELTFKQLAIDVATLQGDCLALECSPDESPIPDFENRVRIIAPGILSSLILDTPPEDFSDPKKLSSDISIDENGTVTLKLPEDFLKLVSIRMSDWKRSVTQPVVTGQLDHSLQSSRFAALRGNPERPVVMKGFDNAGNRCLRLFTSSRDATLAEGLYMASPDISGDSISIPEGLYHQLVARLAESIKP